MRFAIALLALFLLPIAHSEFLVGSGNAGQKIWVLCENESAVFVSFPSGASERLSLGENYQANFIPDTAGPYAIQCGHETKTIDVAAENAKAETTTGAQEDFFAIFALLVFFGLFMAATALVANYLFFSRTIFTKIVEGGNAKLVLQAGKRLEKIEMADPVAIGFSGEEMRFSIPKLGAGKQWAFEYEMEEPQNALPASLEAYVSGQKISMLSNLYIEGERRGGGAKQKRENEQNETPKLRRTISKASD